MKSRAKMELTERQKRILRGIFKDREHFAGLDYTGDGIPYAALGGYRIKIQDARRGLVSMNAAGWLGHVPTASERVMLSTDYRVLESHGLIERRNLSGYSTRTTHLRLTEAGEVLAKQQAKEHDHAER